MSALQGLYRGIFRRTSTFALVFCTGGLVYAMYLDKALDTVFRNLNKGKMYEDVQAYYSQKKEE
ncbi:Hypothetical predicted protein [Mytilus galloprovincialis]|uniref:Complex III subunit 9 n=1 Tax=Mytilus galloprovincialis TaxID=29158 RepID=A0A8B6E2D1_MYTGA|nr:Hypothetical predicted protein [Mytilus galloprovincialis]